ncbi:FAD-binding oxidoreductase [Hydrogenibacillus schlegelii]|uniref:FAD-binding PCMH-type domain-containing protein n=1 Tax=Hydrogenibacillus schlegelii TaxID=1484 RepID=A0A132MH67_HYDSH|nr:FAD-binding oxidoreductase [Hydrogenibacillus schlegelii]KWW97184.1 hypothetical protein TR75_10000 [Hydrogenibacillus schlegelii]OAR04834.1 hypothetical protein SA87_07585 [Hydrogenibacillus schlegelii]
MTDRERRLDSVLPGRFRKVADDRYGGLPPTMVVPRTVEEAQAIVREARASGETVAWFGTGSRRGLGRPATAAIGLSLMALKGVVDYRPHDLVVTVRAGTTVAELAAVLAPEGQRLAVDVPNPERTTIGGAVAADAFGWRRHRHGGFRDHLLGLRMISASGDLLRFGGTVMKNVAGYDMPKLAVGALGTIGGAVEFSFRLRPLPRARASVVAFFPPARWPEIEAALAAALRAPIEPEALWLLSPAAAGDAAGRWGLVVPFAGEPAAIAAEEERLRRLLPRGAGVEVSTVGEAEERALFDRLSAALAGSPPWPAFYRPMEGSEAVARAEGEPGAQAGDAEAQAPDSAPDRAPIVLRFGLRSTDVPEALRQAEALGRAEGFSPQVFGCFGSGVAWAVLGGASADAAPSEIEAARRVIAALREAFPYPRGIVRIEHGPATLRQAVDPWGIDERTASLFRRLHRALDPEGRFLAARLA